MNDISGFLAAWTAAEENADTAALERLLADDFIAVGPLGFTLTKQDWLDRHGTGSLTYQRFGLDETQVREFGDTTVVIGRQYADGAYQANPIPEAVRCTLILTGRAEDRRLSVIHMSFIAGTPGAPPIPGRPPQQENAS